MNPAGNLGNRETMAKNIQYYMDISKKSRRDVCEATGIKYSTLTEWLNANKYPRIDKIEILANYFGIEKSDLVEERVSKQIIEKGDTASTTEKLNKSVYIHI